MGGSAVRKQCIHLKQQKASINKDNGQYRIYIDRFLSFFVFVKVFTRCEGGGHMSICIIVSIGRAAQPAVDWIKHHCLKMYP